MKRKVEIYFVNLIAMCESERIKGHSERHTSNHLNPIHPINRQLWSVCQMSLASQSVRGLNLVYQTVCQAVGLLTTLVATK